MKSSITLGSSTVTVVKLPGEDLPFYERPVWFRSVSMAVEDSIASVGSPYTGEIANVFEWPGAESWTGTIELPSMTAADEAPWRAFLLQCRGMSNAILIGDDRHRKPAGIVDGKSQPVCDTSLATNNLAMSKYLITRGWQADMHRLVKAGDYLQIGYRLYTVLDDVASDANGAATLELWPSLREQPPDGTKIILNNPRGLFRLGQNKTTFSYDYTRLSHMSFPIREYR